MSNPRIFRAEVLVGYDKSWEDALCQGAPDTSLWSPIGLEGQNPNWTASSVFQTSRKGIIVEKQRWVQFGRRFDHQTALDYAKTEGVVHIHPRGIFAFTEKHKWIADDNGEDAIFLTSALTCYIEVRRGKAFRENGPISDGVCVPLVRINRDGRRYARMDSVEYGFSEQAWFGFVE